ncbi:MAG: type II 3-dehydroquinate dehydratase [Muribaculaceae bacterium]|nr:type II 3-dehydroquinate dehydratase [Muribaculaceae bacterium]
MKKILVLDGPNLNLVGVREPQIYGTQPVLGYLKKVKTIHQDIKILYTQSNSEGKIIDTLQKYGFDETFEGIVLNAGAYTHTSLAIADCIRAITVPVVEVHISNVAAREPIRRQSLIAPACRGVIQGFGLKSYKLAIESFL